MTPLPLPVLAPQAPSDEELRADLLSLADQIDPPQIACLPHTRFLAAAAMRNAALALGRTAPPADKSEPMLVMTGYQLRAAAEFVNPDPGDTDQLESEVCIQWGPERDDGEGNTEPAGLRVWLADYPEEGSMALDPDKPWPPEDVAPVSAAVAAPAVARSEKIAPVQGYQRGIPWRLHLEAYDAYCTKWSPQPALIDLEGRNCRGGFGTEELDEFVPGWRERISEVGKLRARVAELEAAHGIVAIPAQQDGEQR